MQIFASEPWSISTLQTWSHATPCMANSAFLTLVLFWLIGRTHRRYTHFHGYTFIRLQLRTSTEQNISSTKQKVRQSHNRNTNNSTIAPSLAVIVDNSITTQKPILQVSIVSPTSYCHRSFYQLPPVNVAVLFALPLCDITTTACKCIKSIQQKRPTQT